MKKDPYLCVLNGHWYRSTKRVGALDSASGKSTLEPKLCKWFPAALSLAMARRPFFIAHHSTTEPMS